MQKRRVVAYRGGFADDDAGAVIEHDALADARCRMDIDGENAAGLALQVVGEIAPSLVPQFMREAVRDQRMEALEIEQRLDQAIAGGVAIEDGVEVGPEDLADVRRLGQHGCKRLADQRCIDIRMMQALGKPMADRILEPVVVENGREDEPAQCRLTCHGFLGLGPHLTPDRVDLFQVAARIF